MRNVARAGRAPRVLTAAVAAVLAASFLLVPRATVVISGDLPRVTARVRIEGRPLTPGTRESTARVRATGRIAPAPARGFVRFDVPTPTGFEILSDLPSPANFTIPAGTAVYACPRSETIQGECTHGVAFETTEPAVMTRQNEQCFLWACSIVSNRVNIVALRNGPSGNVRADWIRDTDVSAPNGNEVDVSTGWPTRGGTLERDPALTREDVRRGLARLRDQMRKEVVADLEAQAEKKGLALTMIRLDTTARPGRHGQLGREVESATVHDTMSGEAWGYVHEDLLAVASSALSDKVPQGYRVLEDTLEEDALRREETGQVFEQVVMRVTALAAPVDEDAVVESARGATPGDLEQEFASAPGVSDVHVDQWPVDLPLLPLFGSRIDVRFRDAS